MEIIGDQYDEYADAGIGELADLLQRDIDDVHGDGEMYQMATIRVTAPREAFLRADVTAPGADATILDEVVRAVAELASHYQRVDLDHPDQARFQLVIVTHDPVCGCARTGYVVTAAPYPLAYTDQRRAVSLPTAS